ncbi:Bicaudal D-related [Amphibalanus amphitrite]|uniref:Bicaudal D-related n=1 Tax=Amphibalanus amphitrite TaxID=1232801 RepID=A0A6A4WKV0_AMPAM|nr:Bicaudal D-related [Amphibalanus amphitrite]
MANQADYLEEYISAMESRDEPESGDVYSQLRQKENDLVLAAELGKALLEKNEALSMENERMAEDYSKHLECAAIITATPPSSPKRRHAALVGAVTHSFRSRPPRRTGLCGSAGRCCTVKAATVTVHGGRTGDRPAGAAAGTWYRPAHRTAERWAALDHAGPLDRAG